MSNDFRQAHRDSMRKLRATARENGICINCISRPAAPGRGQCEHCLAKGRKRAQDKQDAATALSSEVVARRALDSASRKI